MSGVRFRNDDCVGFVRQNLITGLWSGWTGEPERMDSAYCVGQAFPTQREASEAVFLMLTRAGGHA